ncbi:V-type proton ATPase subunit G [Drechslerella dactyloides]|uniref:V-type proton ATPase subunit G n=1 Tax=Drechslerella dactyloides TaxID=74499 RepID=A0AAD6J4F8_DREDA|nr:V-type proton ATPase subunit G [Drechslerella dactyloides]
MVLPEPLCALSWRYRRPWLGDEISRIGQRGSDKRLAWGRHDEGQQLPAYQLQPNHRHRTSKIRTPWIQTLLNAEQEAQKIVQKDRVQRVKDARAEAQKEIEEYRQKKEEEFNKFESEHTGINAQAEKDAEKEIEGKLQEIADAGKKHRNQVVKDLIAAATTVKAKPHVNSKPAQ